MTSDIGVNFLDSEMEDDARAGGRRPTSAELNRKEPLGYSVDYDSETDGGVGEGESQIFPGSGLF